MDRLEALDTPVRGGFRGWVIGLAGCVAVFAFAQGVSAQTRPAAGNFAPASAPAASRAPSNRFLFVMDTSTAMKRHAEAAVPAVVKILRSAAGGQIHPGDTVGVWTFNETLETGKLPLQAWMTEDTEEIALRTAEFLKRQPYEKTSRLEIALAGINEIVSNSDIITIFLVSDGSGQVQGTPFDFQINALQAQSRQDMKKDLMPIITVLQGKGGKLIKFTVNPLPWPVVVPEVPIDLKIAQAPRAAPPTNTVAAAPPLTAPLRPVPTNAQVAATAPIVAAPVQPAAQPPTTEPARVEPTPGLPRMEMQPQGGPQPGLAAAPPVSAPPAMTAPPVSAAPPETVTTVPVPTAPTVMPAPTEQPPPAARPQTAPSTLPAIPARSGVRPPETVVAATPPAASPKPAPVPPATAAPEPAPAPTGAGTNSIASQAVALVKFYTDGPRKYFLIGGLGLFIVALFLIRMMVRRSRRASRISLISQTLNDHNR